ncbi:PREDICTED: protein MALE DISCOVERER 2-like isoform X3 [Lupinus angustifolius]|uniref:protein MALE DISCOVERER 2-like isoform X3 n=1 Tax=Lupinus angustifolius TaxID=3871 RepID=UPI00092EFC69|nr:PREDICTED: protein MALE DISCOVERER 2-like isoform X3 [Lupinus angustifolius]
MENNWDPFGLWVRICFGMVSFWGIQQCWSLNDEGLALLEFRVRITSDPYGSLANWNPNDCDPCMWSGIHCVDGKVQMLNLNGLYLEGTLAPELGKLSHLKSLVLCKNNFSGTIPKELGDLRKLELLNLRENKFTGSIPEEIGRMSSLKRLDCDNKIEDIDSAELEKLRVPSKFLFYDNYSSNLLGSKNRKFGRCSVWHRVKQWNKADSLVIPIKRALIKYLNVLALSLFKLRKASLHDYEENRYSNLPRSEDKKIGRNVSNLVNSARRKLLDQSSNLEAEPYSGGGRTIQINPLPTTLSSGSFSAVPDANKKQNQPPASLTSPSSSPHDTLNERSEQHGGNGSSRKWWKYLIIISVVAVLVIAIMVMLFVWRKRAAKVIKPWTTGLSGQLQKAFITGVPKLNRAELEIACEDFSNIVASFNEFNIYKGTLSSGVEIAVVSTVIASSEDWSKSMQSAYRKKIDTLSRVNHKNFVNLIGYCDEEEPFTRMMVFEYSPNGCLFEHLHSKDVEHHLDWSERMRIIMGTAYCLEYMHDRKPSVFHTNLSSLYILLTDDYAAKIGEMTFGQCILTPSNRRGDPSKKCDLPPHSDPETDVYNFGILLLETISGKLPYSEEHGNLVNWAAEYVNDKQRIRDMIDPTLQSYKDNELNVLCEVIQDCILSDPRLRPPMKDITPKLREGLQVSPEQAVPRLSPLWWAELEILSGEAT